MFDVTEASQAGPVAVAKPLDPAWAWAPYQPGADRPWDMRLAGHLYRRAAFGASWAQMEQALADGPQKTIDKLLAPGPEAEQFNRTLDQYEAAAIDPNSSSTEGFRQWWLRRMIQTPHPLLEKMVLFWHNHFATRSDRVGDARQVQQYVCLLRSHALGRFSALLGGMVRDPAMLVGLDLGTNPQSRPSENLARPLLELFTVGPGNFSERDVREAARALTGWSVARGQLRRLEHQHDTTSKTILGKTGNWSDTDAVGILLEHPGTSRRLVRQLYRWMISEAAEPSEELIAPLAESFAKDYDVSALLRTMLGSNVFFSPLAYRQRIKSPTEFVLGIVRPLEALIPTAPLGAALAALGQDLCNPPSSKGWIGGCAWITPATLIGRHNLAVSLLGGDEPYGEKFDPLAQARKRGHASPEAAAQFLVDLLLQGDLDGPARQAVLSASPKPGKGDDAQSAWLRGLTQRIAALPEFQLA